MRHSVPSPEESLALAGRVNEKYQPVWNCRSSEERVALARYFLPHSSRKSVLGPTRPRVIKWYCPFAAQAEFPSGHRYCINVYTGCDHKCVYCYAAGYEPDHASGKQNFEKLIAKDMEDLDRFDVPAAPVHLSNSTDLFQPLETEMGDAKFALEQILAHRNRFTTVTLLTKNPMLPVDQGYLGLFQALNVLPPDHPRYEEFDERNLPGLCAEVSLAFSQERPRAVYDPNAPGIEERKAGIRALHQAGIPLVLRIDPLFPRSPLTEERQKTLDDFGLPEAQTIEDLECLVSFAREIDVRHVVYSPAKITQPRGGKLSDSMRAMRTAYEHFVVPEKLIWRGGSWRLPQRIAAARIVQPFLEICRREGVTAKHCKQNLVETP